MGFSRRNFLGQALAAPLALGLPRWAASLGEETVQPNPGMVLRQKMPENLEFPFNSLDSFITPNERFYVRNHFPAPQIDIKTWKLAVEGAVEKPLGLRLDDLIKMESHSMTATLECAGNSRGFLVPKENGVLWESGAVSTAKWKGVKLADVLARAGVKNNAVEVILEGADAGAMADPKSPGPIPFSRSIPITKARQSEVLLAYEMNGASLPAAHGYPLRAVVAGWYGMASIKWLKRIVVTDKPFNGWFQTVDYSVFERRHGLPHLVPITEMQVKSAIARPALLEAVKPNSKYCVHGAAWTGEAQVAKVEISTDSGKTWELAEMLGDPVKFYWRLFQYEWRTPAKPGRYSLMAKATDSKGRTQPIERNKDLRNYMISHVLPIDVEVKA